MVVVVTFSPSRRFAFSAPNLCVDLSQVFTANVIGNLPIYPALIAELKKNVLV